MKIICGNEKIEAEEVVREYTTMIYRVAMVRMQNQADAEEIVQDTFLRLFKQVKKGYEFESRDHLKAWLLKVAVNRGVSVLTSAWNKKTEGLDAAHEIPAGENEESYAYDYVMKLPEKYRIAIKLFYYEQLSTEQIAEIMNTKLSTVRSYLLRGREKLKSMMEADGYVG